MGIGGVCKVCGHLLLEVYEGDKNERFVDPMKFRYRCFTCEPESGPTSFAPDAARISQPACLAQSPNHLNRLPKRNPLRR
jgi:hypothetical protein